MRSGGGSHKRWIRLICSDKKNRAFLTPMWTNRHNKRPGDLYEDDLYECAHCGESIKNSPKGQLKKHQCKPL